jgi:hypothetical protein
MDQPENIKADPQAHPGCLQRVVRPHLAVEIRVDGDCVLCLETNSMTGVRDIYKYESQIHEAISWLIVFVGQKPG